MVYNKKINIYIIFQIFLLSLLSCFQCLGKSADYYDYVKIFSSEQYNIEPAFKLIRKVFTDYGGTPSIFFFTSFLSLFFIYSGLKRYSPYPKMAFIFYSITFYWLHEYTQIRVAIAIGVFFLAIPDLEKKRFKIYFLKTVIACCFHYSSIIMILLYFFCLPRRKRFYIVSPFVLFLFDLVYFYIIKYPIPISKIIFLIAQKKGTLLFDILYKMTFQGNKISVFNRQYISYFILLLIMYKLICNKKENENEILMYKILSFCVSLFFILLPTGLSVLTFRISEYFSSIVVIVLTIIIYNTREKKMTLLFVLPYVGMLFTMFISKVIVL